MSTPSDNNNMKEGPNCVKAETSGGRTMSKNNSPKPMPQFDYVETNFRYMSIGSPVPCSDNSPKVSENQYDADLEQDSTGEDDSRTTRSKRNKKAFFGHDFDTRRYPADQKSPARRRKKKPAVAGHEHPAIKVDQCETDSPQLESEEDEERSSDSSGVQSSSHSDVPYALNSGAPTQFFLSPTPPLSRKSEVDSKTVLFYSPALTCSKSEGCLIENTQKDPSLPQYSHVGISAAQSLGLLRSTSKPEVSTADRIAQTSTPLNCHSNHT